MYELFETTLPWRRYRIEIYSEPIRTIPIHSDICIRANANHSEPIRKTSFISFDEKRSKINPINSETKFDSDWKFGLDQSELELIWIENLVSDWWLGINRNKSDWFLTVFHQTRCKTFFGLVRNDSHCLEYRYWNESK